MRPLPTPTSEQPRTVLQRYGIAVVCFSASLAVTLILRRWSGGNEPFYPLFTAGVLCAAWQGGAGPGLLVGGLAVLVNGAIVMGRGSHLMLPAAAEAVRLTAFAAVVVFVSLLAETRKRALRAAVAQHDALRQQAAEMHALLDAVPAAVFVTRDPDVRYVEGNAFSIQLLGVEAAANLSKSPDVPNQAMYRLMKQGVELKPEELPLQQAVSRGEPVRNREFDVESTDGTTRTLIGNAVPFRDDQGRAAGAIGAFVDITERKRAEEAWRLERARVEQALRDQAAQLAHANRIKDEFLATLSHELRTPLNAVLGWSHMLTTGKLPATTQQQAFRAIERNADAQRRIIEDLLDVSRIITGRFRLDVQPTDVIEAVGQAVETVRPAADAKKIDVTVRCEPAEPLTVMADPSRLQQVLWNLLLNAVKFTSASGRIDVTVKTSGAHVSVQVKDNGIGIPADFLPHVFERFRQRDSTTTRAHGGLGLGLAIVRYVVEMHGGTVKADSAGEGHGATFTVTLPLADVADAVVPAGSSEAPAERLDGLRVLLVDDEREACEMLVTLLGGCGAEVTVAASADAALRDIEAGMPDIVISDIAMPEKDGVTLMRELRARGYTMPVIALSALGHDEERQRAFAAGFDLHILKPALPGQLLPAITMLVQRRTQSG